MNLFKRLNLKLKAPARDPRWKEETLGRLQDRLRGMVNQDELIPLLCQLLDEFAADDLDAGCGPHVSDEEAHRSLGRLGMCLELKAALGELWRKSREKKPE